MTALINLLDDTRGAWLKKFGCFSYGADGSIDAVAGVPTGGGTHAETQFSVVLGADFTYSADVTLPADAQAQATDAHLQFRISDEGRYGIGIRSDGVRLYRFVLPDRPCSTDVTAFNHCPLWGNGPDLPDFFPMGTIDITVAPGSTITVTITARGPHLTVSVGPQTIDVQNATDFAVGRFGLYAFSRASTLGVQFTNIRATTDASARSNFALLYSTAGYDAARSKRAILRTLNDLPATELQHAKFTFNLVNDRGDTYFVKPPPLLPVASVTGHTLGFQAWTADFTELRVPGRYTLTVSVTTADREFHITSDPFVVENRHLSQRALKPLSVRNAQARRAADDDFRRNWQIESGHDAWSVGVDGAFIADHADDAAGATMRRVFNINNEPLVAQDFRYLGRITIVDGCDAQLQFRITNAERWAVTLQAGSAGNCRHGVGPGAVRLHREGPGLWQPVAAASFQPGEFMAGRPYDVEVRARGPVVVVLVDGQQKIWYHYTPDQNPMPGQFGLKAWASSARFERVQAWVRDVALSHPDDGVWIPYVPYPDLLPGPSFGQSAQSVPITVKDTDVNRLYLQEPDHDTSYPLLAQYHGFHDCNSYIGEVTSHAIFLAGLMDLWCSRAAEFGRDDREALRDAIVAAVLYLFNLYEQGNFTGRFAHQEPGRAVLGATDGAIETGHAVYGLSSFAAFGAYADRALARRALHLAKAGWDWLSGRGPIDPTLRSIVLARIAIAVEREGTKEEADLSWQDAIAAAAEVLAVFSPAQAMAGRQRECLRSLPWFEGLYEVFTSGRAALDADGSAKLRGIARQLQAVMDDPGNAFRILPQATDEANQTAIPLYNWQYIDALPQVNRPIPHPPDGPVGEWYVCEHYATAALDCACIGKLIGNRDLEPLATANLHWILGINPGVPTSKTVGSNDDLPWRAAAFIYNGPRAFARTIEGNRTVTTSAKGWRADWEDTVGSRHRESWAFDPLDNGFQSIVNGHVLTDRQWHYWSVGSAGWVSAETFMLIDGSFIKAAIALEDWDRMPTEFRRPNPYDTSVPTFLDTIHTDRTGTDWVFDDPDRTPHAIAARCLHEIAVGKGFFSARPTGHHIGERVGAITIPLGAEVLWVRRADIENCPWPFDDIDHDPWAQVARTATEFAVVRHGYAGGFFTGNLQGTRDDTVHELICLRANLATAFDARDYEVNASPWKFTDINTVGWAQAARVATGIAINKGYAGGFFTGHQVPDGRGIIGLLAR